jgi:hypothetical protein
MPGAPAAVGQLQAQGELLAHQGLEREVGVGAQRVDVGAQGFVGVHGFVQREALDHQGAGGQCGVQLDEAGGLAHVEFGRQAAGQVVAQAAQCGACRQRAGLRQGAARHGKRHGST